jgi:hypothetical protein
MNESNLVDQITIRETALELAIRSPSAPPLTDGQLIARAAAFVRFLADGELRCSKCGAGIEATELSAGPFLRYPRDPLVFPACRDDP